VGSDQALRRRSGLGKDLERYRALVAKIPSFKGTLGTGAEALAAALVFLRDLGLVEERLACYAALRESEDQGLSASRDRTARFMMSQADAQTAWSYFDPEIHAIPDDRMAGYLKHPALAEFAIWLRKLLRFKPHVLSEKEERLLAMQIESNQTASNAFSVLTDVDFDFGTIDTKDGTEAAQPFDVFELLAEPGSRPSPTRLRALLRAIRSVQDHPWRALRRIGPARSLRGQGAQPRFVAGHGLVSRRHARVGLRQSGRGGARGLPALHRYYELRRKALKLDQLCHYDVRVPLVPTATWRHSYDQAVDVVQKALAPLGKEYGAELGRGLRGGWVDRYENKGKASGAFSYGSFSAEPYILMNFKEELLDDVFTLAHEAGHSMHSYFSARSNAFLHWHYTTFEAEVASTFNEQLLGRYLAGQATSDEVRAYLINKEVDSIIGSLFRQTMFAEFEAKTHALVESGTPLTVDVLRSEYRVLLECYFGRGVKLETISDLEGLRIPHFYRAFYVYTYATGISAAIALADRVLGGGEQEREDYFTFLRSGGSRYPIESLKVAGVDMSSPVPVQAAIVRFEKLVGELGKYLGVG
jgi:oligoendopeptidase F